MWDVILSCLVIFHLVTEYVHYTYEYFSGNREKNILVDIQRHRMRSNKTAMLEQMQRDLDLIKAKLEIKE
jgi:hypothetical protein